MTGPTRADIDALVAPATPHFAYQLRARVRELIGALPADDATLRIDDLSRARQRVRAHPLHRGRRVAVGDEADLLTFRLVGGRQTEPAGLRAHAPQHNPRAGGRCVACHKTPHE